MKMAYLVLSRMSAQAHWQSTFSDVMLPNLLVAVDLVNIPTEDHGEAMFVYMAKAELLFKDNSKIDVNQKHYEA